MLRNAIVPPYFDPGVIRQGYALPFHRSAAELIQLFYLDIRPAHTPFPE